VPWPLIALSTDAHGKPCYVPPDPPLPRSDGPHQPDASASERENKSEGRGESESKGEKGGGGAGIVKFNVSHQAGLVVLIGSTSPTAEVGIDVVNVAERAGRDMAGVRKGGLAAWVEIYGEVFSGREVEEMKWSLPVPVSVPVSVCVPGALSSVPGSLSSPNDDLDGNSDGNKDGTTTMTLSPDLLLPLARCSKPDVLLPLSLTLPLPVPVAVSPLAHTPTPTPTPTPPPTSHAQPVAVTVSSTPLIASKLRNFYAHWCLKEAYIKMTGEALLAPWLRDLEFRNVRPPAAASSLSSSVAVASTVGRTSSVLAVEEEGTREGRWGGGGAGGAGEAGLEGGEERDGGGGGGTGGGKEKWGETVDSESSFEIYRFGERMRWDDGKVRVELTAWEEGFMIGSAVSVSVSGSGSGSGSAAAAATTAQGEGEGKAKTIEFGEFEELDLERDVLRIAEAGG